MGGDGQYWACAECARKCSKVHGRTSPPSHLSFFKIMLGPFEKSLIVPPKFARLLGNLVGQEVCLENSDGHHWKVKLLKVDNCLAFQQGWNEFVLYHSIQVGEIVVFKYISHASFVVQIFGTSGCERSHFSEIIDSDMHKKCPTDCLSFRKDGRKDATCRVGSCIQDKVSSKEMKSIGTTPCESFSSQHLSKADGDFHKRKRSATECLGHKRKRSATECLGHKRKRSATECLAPHNDGRTHDKYAVPCCPTPKDSARKRQAVRTAFCETPAAPKNAAKNTWEDSNMQQISSSHNMTNTSEPLTATTVDYSEVPCIVVSEDVHKGQEETQLPLSDVCADVNMNPVNNDAEKGVKGSQKALTDTYANVNMGQVDHLELPCKLSKTESLKEKEMIATLLSEFMPSRVGKVNADKSVIIEKKSFYSTNSKASKKLKGNKSDLPSTENEANIMHSLTEMGISLTSCLDVAPISSEISLSGEPSCKKLVIEPPISGLSNKNIVSEEDKSEAAKDNILGKASTANNFISAYDVATYRFLVDKEGTCYIVHNSIDNPVSNSTNANLPNNDMEDAKCSVSVAPTAKEISFHSDVVPKDLCSAPIVGSRDEKSAKKTILTSTTDDGRHAQSCHLDTGGSNAAAIPAENDALSVGDAPQQMSRILTSKEGSDTMNESHEHGVNQDAVSQKNKKFKLCLQEPVLKAVKTEIMDPDDLSSPYFCFSLVVNTLSCHDARDTAVMDMQVHLHSLEAQLATTRADLETLRAQQEAVAGGAEGASSSRDSTAELASLEQRLAGAVERAVAAECDLAARTEELQAAITCIEAGQRDMAVRELSEPLPSNCGRWRLERKVVLLRDPAMRVWPVLYHESFKFTGFLGGWEAFVTANDIGKGDTCYFETASHTEPMLQVQISRASNL